MDAARFHSNYDTFPEPLLLQDPEGEWLFNPAADVLSLSQTDLEQLAVWDGSASIWLAGRFFHVHGHRTADGLFLVLSADAFLSSAALSLSANLRQRLSLAFHGVNDLQSRLNGNSDEVKEDLATVNRALFQIFRIVTQLDQCGEVSLSCNKSYLELTGWFACLAQELREYCAADGVSLHVSCPSPSAPLPVMGDSHLLECMVSHLVSNAIKAAPDDKAEITVALKKQGAQAVLTVSGNGVGLSPSFLTDPLWNQPARLLPGRGLGLGLPVAQRIAALHGGTLMVSPTKDGSQVTVSLPLDLSGDRLASPAPHVEPVGGFSPVRIILSDALSTAAYHPDFKPHGA